MKKPFLLPLAVLLALAAHASQAQTLFLTRHAQLSFFSKTPLEDISARSTSAVSAIDLKSRSIYFKVDNTSFAFPQKLMQEHFNENYIESSKYPVSEFRGQLATEIDPTVDGTYPVLVSGKLKLHGVEKAYQQQGTVTVKDHKVLVAATFPVLLKDHNIDIPNIVIAKIAEQVQVTVSAEYELHSALTSIK
ncbi:YceI family protein [uncultured Hymenobacter sp.]|uniref:YceI family protein n=1 Tax=uncultured Hymenobacter sp. TaxID=170016 RepID=UPI0035CCA44B